jgi:hypothetical protein
MYLITERLWNTLQENSHLQKHKEQHLIVIDEAWFLSKFTSGGAFLNEFARRIRKYHGSLWMGTQQIEDLLATQQGQDLLALCDTKLVFKQAASSLRMVSENLHLSSIQADFVSHAGRGEALMMSNQDTFGIEIIVSEREAAMARTTTVDV